jgi:ABC-2 type transport system ATP-binding protein
MTDHAPLVQLRALTKRFGKTTAIAGIDLDIHPGSVIGLLGANGAGKSTLLRHITGMYLPDRGTCTTLGCDAGRLDPARLARIGYVHQDSALLDWMTVRQFVRYVAAYYPTWNAALEQRFMADFELTGSARVGALSPGQRQRLAILIAIAFEPELLLLDEPAAALDPLARLRFLDLLIGIIQDERRAVVISSHILSDVEKVIDRVLIMDKGRILRDCPLDQLQDEFHRLRLTALTGTLPQTLPLPGLLECRRSATDAVVVLRRLPDERLERLGQDLGCRVEPLPLPLEELYRLVLAGPV